MRGFSRRIAMVLALTLVAAPALAATRTAPRPTPHAPKRAPAKSAPSAFPEAMSLGNPRAPIRLDEYASLTCPHCARFQTDVFPALKAKYIDTGKVRYTLHEFLTPPAEAAVAGWLIARCAGQTRYFSVVDAIFRSQSRWTDGRIKPVLLDVAAKAGGLSTAQVDTCLADDKAIDALYGRMEMAMKASKVQATPTFIINGKLAKEGEMTLDELDAAIAAAGK